VEPRAQTRDVYLPEGAAWFDFRTGARFEGGQTVNRLAGWDLPVVLVREGSVIPVATEGDGRGFLIHPPAQGACEGESYEDDGESEAAGGAWLVSVQAGEALRIGIERQGAFLDGQNELTLLLPETEQRALEVTGGRIEEETFQGGRRVARVVSGA
jgi:alpha-glucosidase